MHHLFTGFIIYHFYATCVFFPLPDLNSNVKSLQYMLNHPLVFRTKPVLPLDEPQPPFRPLTKVTNRAVFSMSLNGLRVMDYDEACFMHLTPGVVHNFSKAVGV